MSLRSANGLSIERTGLQATGESRLSARASEKDTAGAKRAAEKLVRTAICGGFVSGHEFTRAAIAPQSTWALAPEGCFPGFPSTNRPYPAASDPRGDLVANSARLKSCPDTWPSQTFAGVTISAVFLCFIGTLAALPAAAQYPGQVSKGDKETPELRSIAVLEYTGEEGKPKASRLVPVAVLDGGELQDGGIYLARPEPLALFPEVEYELEQNGQPVGLYDIASAGQQLGSWFGFGAWKPMPSAKPRPSAQELAKTRFDDDDGQSDTPVLHRKHHADDPPTSGSSASGSGGDTTAPAAPSDPDRPVLHKKASSESADSSGSGAGAAGTPASTGTAPAQDNNGPVLHKKDSNSTSDSGAGSASSDDPDRPVLKKSKKSQSTQTADTGSVESVGADTDPDRPRLKRGKSSGDAIEVAPSLAGLPPDAQQMVAVSDAKHHAVHPWSYAWSNPDDEAKMRSALEDIARDALGLNPPPAPAKTAAKRTTTRKTTKPPPPPPPAPAPLEDEQFRVFELAYGSGATLVLSAHTGGTGAQQKFVTLIAQPDLYGNMLVLKKSVTDSAHLDEKPRMRLVDAVDALADNRGELLFELRGATQRQFGLYRVLRGQAEQLFVTGPGQFGTEGSQ